MVGEIIEACGDVKVVHVVVQYCRQKNECLKPAICI